MKIQSTSTHSAKQLKILVYGAPGVGKTTLASTINEPVLLISAEAGLLSLADHNIDVIDITTDDDGKPIPKERRLARLGEVIRYVQSEEAMKKYQWLFIDSLTEISQNLIENLQLVYPDAKDGLKLWGDYAKKSRSLVKSFRDLPHYNVVFTALETEEKDDNGRRYIRVDMQGKIGKQLPAFFDLVFRMHLVEDVKGKPVRVMTTQTRENVVAKDRSGKLEDKIEPNLGAVANTIRGKTNEVKTNAVRTGVSPVQKSTSKVTERRSPNGDTTGKPTNNVLPKPNLGTTIPAPKTVDVTNSPLNQKP